MSEQALDQELLEILACPETKEAVQLASAEVLAGINGRVHAGTLQNRGGQAVVEALQAALVRGDGKVAYPVKDGIPIMLVEESILLE